MAKYNLSSNLYIHRGQWKTALSYLNDVIQLIRLPRLAINLLDGRERVQHAAVLPPLQIGPNIFSIILSLHFFSVLKSSEMYA